MCLCGSVCVEVFVWKCLCGTGTLPVAFDVDVGSDLLC
jgi:hypothetical protein